MGGILKEWSSYSGNVHINGNIIVWTRNIQGKQDKIKQAKIPEQWWWKKMNYQPISPLLDVRFLCKIKETSLILIFCTDYFVIKCFEIVYHIPCFGINKVLGIIILISLFRRSMPIVWPIMSLPCLMLQN